MIRENLLNGVYDTRAHHLHVATELYPPLLSRRREKVLGLAAV
jgi:hypothetical protein